MSDKTDARKNHFIYALGPLGMKEIVDAFLCADERTTKA